MESPLHTPASSQSSTAPPAASSVQRKNFDDRSHTAVSLQLRARRPSVGEQDELARLRSRLDATKNGSNIVNWSETTQICRTLNSPQFVSNFGTPSALELSPTHILIGTDTGRVAGFNYHQNLDYILEIEPVTDGDPAGAHVAAVTCVAVSSNGLSVCAGQKDGTVVVWELSRVSPKPAPAVVLPYDVIKSVSLRERAASSEVSGHLHGVPINTVSFVGDSHQNLVTSDVSGLVLFHHGFQKLFRKKFVSQRLLGYHVATSDDILDRFSVHDCQVLPIGTAPQLTDHIGLLAVITSNILVVLSICSLNNETTSYPMTHFKVTRPKTVHVDEKTPLGCLAWYPSIKGKDQGSAKNAKLAYSWNNVLTILELDNSHIPSNAMAILADLKDKDRAIPTLQMAKKARWSAPTTHCILSLKWLNSEILTALVQDGNGETRLHFLYYNCRKNACDLDLVGVDDLDSQRVSSIDYTDDPNSDLRFYNSVLRIFRHRPVILVDSHAPCSKSFFTGNTSKWADRLVGLITAKNFVSALWCAYEFYCSDNVGQLLLSGLPHTARERHDVVEPFLLDIMRESVAPFFTSHDSQNPHSLSVDGLWLYLHITGMISADRGATSDALLDILDAVHDVFPEKHVFFDILEKFIMAGKIKTLSPTIFKSLVENYAEAGLGDRLTEIVCILDSATLNLDLTLKLCETHVLRECRVYIWTALLKDYMRPFMMLISDMDSERYDDDQKKLVYTYMSYILSGRQFPTDEYMGAAEETSARGVVCKVLFALRGMDDETREYHVTIDPRTVFPYLHKFLRFSAFETLATLNEFFENPCLNTDSKSELNRQYVIEALIDTFRENKDAFSSEDRTHLAIFLARNYPKYFQFIRISDSVLEETVAVLCNCPKACHEDAQLALESLLPVYDAKNEAFFQEQIKAAKFYRVAFGLNRSTQRFSSALEIWLQQQNDDEAVDIHNNFAALADIVSHTFRNRSVSPAEKTRLLRIIEENFEQLISRYPRDMVSLANVHNPAIHRMVLQCPNGKLAYEYLHTLFEEIEVPSYGPGKISLIVRFLALSCDFAKEDVCSLTETFSGELLRSPTELSEIRQIFTKKHFFDALAILSRNERQYEQAIQELREAITLLSENDEWEKMNHLITIGMSVCDKNKGCWQPLVHALVSLKTPNSGPIPESVNQGIYRCFRKIIDTGETEKNPHFFTEILQNVMEEATVSHVREVLQETLTSFYFDSEIHNITLGKLNGRIRKHMDYIKTDTLRGWILKEKNCASCGKPMYGDEISERHRAAWESREMARVFLGEFDKKEFKDCELALFKCAHGYHSQCLERLGSSGRCVICTS